jgi:hypothetical protein
MHVNEIDIDIGFSFFCPMTGEVISSPEAFGPSSATAFILSPEVDEFDFLSPELEHVWQEVKATHGEALPWELFGEFCKKLEGHDNLVLFSLTSSGIACGPVSSTIHICIDFAYLASEHDEDGEGDECEDEDECEPGEDDGGALASDALSDALLPRHLPLAALEPLLAGYRYVAHNVSDEPGCDATDMLVGYRDLASGEGFMAFEFEGSDEEESCGTPLERLQNGERLAIQLHDGYLADGVELIDGKDYCPTNKEIRASEKLEESTLPGDPRMLPEDTGFYAIGVGLEGDRLAVEPIAISCGMNGESLVRAAEFPLSLRRRLAAYLARLA